MITGYVAYPTKPLHKKPTIERVKLNIFCWTRSLFPYKNLLC